MVPCNCTSTFLFMCDPQILLTPAKKLSFFPFSSAHNEKLSFYKNDYDANTSIKKKLIRDTNNQSSLCSYILLN